VSTGRRRKISKKFPGQTNPAEIMEIKAKAATNSRLCPRDMAKALPYKAREFSQKIDG